MIYQIACPKCDRRAETEFDPAGRRVHCGACGELFRIPPHADGVALLPYDFDLAPAQAAGPATPAAPTMVFEVVREDFRERAKVLSWKALKVAAALYVVGVSAWGLYRVARPEAAPGAAPVVAVPEGHAPVVASVEVKAVASEPPVPQPTLPDVGPGREIETGVEFHEMQLPGGPNPGDSGKLWLYLPAGRHAPRSLPCVMITGAGSNLITGMKLAEGDRPEHLSYVRGGFAVLAYEMDGAVEGGDSGEAEVTAAARKFLAARAGLANAHVALEFLKAKVPQVDPGRVFAAGHSSAGTAAILLAEHEPSLAGCVAFAPAIDLAKQFGREESASLRALGLGDFLDRYSPASLADALSCPLFLFHAEGDAVVPAQESKDFAARLKALNKWVDLELVPDGDHYSSMIDPGIIRAVGWLQRRSMRYARPAPPGVTSSSGGATLLSASWVDAASDRVGRVHQPPGRPNGEADQHLRVELEFGEPTTVHALDVFIPGTINRWDTRPGDFFWPVGVYRGEEAITAGQVKTVGTFHGRQTFQLYLNGGFGVGRDTPFVIELELSIRGERHSLRGLCRHP